MFADQYIEKEDNNKIKDVIFEFLTTDNISLHKIDMDDPDISDYQMIPDTCYLSNRLRSCLQVSRMATFRVQKNYLTKGKRRNWH